MSKPADTFDFLPLISLDTQGHCCVCSDSRKIKKNDIFMAYIGEYADGRDYIQAAIEQGASTIIYQQDQQYRLPENISIPCYGVKELRQQAGTIAAALYHNPSEQLSTIGVTGTNGKTSISQWLAQAFDLLGKKCGIIGTVGNGFWEALQPSTHTTPDAVELQTLLAQLLSQHAQAVSIEVSSHGLHQHRVQGVAFDTAILSNISRDHLDYHGNLHDYAAAKKRLFDMPTLKHIILNIDDEYGRLWATEYQQNKNVQTITYGFSADADVRIIHFQAALNGNHFSLKTPWGDCTLSSQLLGRFNAQNLAACVASLALHGFDLSEISQIVPQIKAARGRMQSIIQENCPLILIDYAHTPDALEKALQTLQELKTAQSRLWCVFGCGGNRDKGKRPLMGQAAQNHADCVVITSDNPRFEEPQSIIDDILPAVFQPAFVDISRQKAIEYAVKNAGVHDIILIAGKGHETYQDIQGVKQHFDDFECAENALKLRLIP